MSSFLRTTYLAYYRPLQGALAFACLLLIACGSEWFENSGLSLGEVVRSPNDDREYALIELTNGLEVMLVSDPTVEKSAAALSIGVGAASDPDEYPGMAHYLEHMLFMGSKQFPEPDGFMRFTAEHGGMSNAYTGLDITNYMMLVENEAFNEALDQFSSFFINPLLDPEYIEKEKNAVDAEWSMRREQDFRITYRLARKLLGDHPANRFQIGNLESLADKAEGGLHTATVAFFENYYSANLMKASLIGSEPIAILRAQAERYFSRIPNKRVPEPEITDQLNFKEAGAKLIRYVPQEDIRELRLDFIIDDNSSLFDKKPSEYLAYILSSEMPNTPAVLLRELGWASSLMVSAAPSRYGNYGPFSFIIELTAEGLEHREAIVSMVLGYIEMLREQVIDDRYEAEFGTSLANQFRFLEKMDDFSYAHSLTRAMQFYPSVKAIHAPYSFGGFNQNAVNQVLDQLVQDRLHVWYIDRQQLVSESMYFYDGQFSVETLELQSPAQMLAEAHQFGLDLPAKNKLLPEKFEIVSTGDTPHLLIDEPDLSLWLQGSSVFSGLPRGYTQMYLNSPLPLKHVDAAVMLSIWSDLFRLEQTALMNEAAIAGMGLTFSVDQGLRITLSGFTDKQPQLLAAAISGLRVAPTEQQLNQAIDRFIRSLENRKRDLPIRQLGRTLATLTQTGFYDEESLLKAAGELTSESFLRFINQLLKSAGIRVYLFGNYDKDFAMRVAREIRAALPAGRVVSAGYSRQQVYSPEQNTTLVFNTDLPVEDLGMLYLFAAQEPTIDNEASGRVLSQHLRNRAFGTLRTEEQLGYAAGGMAGKLQDHPFLGFYIQTPVKPPVEMLERFDNFTREYGEMLKEISAEEFENLKSGVLTQLSEPPKNLAEEASPFVSDWNRENYQFNTRAKLISAVEAVSLDDIRSYYENTVLTEMPRRILVQMKGERWAKEPFAVIKGAQIVDSVEVFHKAMPVQSIE